MLIVGWFFFGGRSSETALESQDKSQTERCADENHEVGGKKYHNKGKGVIEPVSGYQQIYTHRYKEEAGCDLKDHLDLVHAGSYRVAAKDGLQATIFF